MGNPGKASYGGIIRDQSGGWVKGFNGKLPGLYSPLEAEAWAIIKGLKIVKKFGFRKVLVETDSVAAMQLFSFRHLHQNHSMKDVIEEGLEILVQQKCVIVHTRREGNSCADKLAELGGRQVRESNVIHTPPPEVVKLLLKDRFGENWILYGLFRLRLLNPMVLLPSNLRHCIPSIMFVRLYCPLVDFRISKAHEEIYNHQD